MSGILKSCLRAGWLAFLLVGPLRAAASPSPPAVKGEKPPTIVVALGSQRIVSVGATIRQVNIDDPVVADVRVIGAREVLVLGASEGKTALLISTKAGKTAYVVSVQKKDPQILLEEFKRAMGAIDGDIAFRIVGNSVFVEGCTATVEAGQRFQAALRKYPDMHWLNSCDNALGAPKRHEPSK